MLQLASMAMASTGPFLTACAQLQAASTSAEDGERLGDFSIRAKLASYLGYLKLPDDSYDSV